MSGTTLKVNARKALAWLPMHICFYAGEAGFQICDRWPGDWADEKRWHDFIPNLAFPLYQRGMNASMVLNDWAGFTLWNDAPPYIE